MTQYHESRQHEFWQGVFFLLLVAFMLLVVPLAFGQKDSISIIKLGGDTLERFPYPIFQQRLYGVPVGQYVVVGADGYLTGADGGSPGGGLASFQGRSTPAATLTASDVQSILAGTPFHVHCSDPAGNGDYGLIASDQVNTGSINCVSTFTIDPTSQFLNGYDDHPELSLQLDSLNGTLWLASWVHAHGLDVGAQRITSVANGVSSDDAATMAQLNGLSATYAPKTNPAGGQNNYAPIASPTTTGVNTSGGGFNAGGAKITNMAAGVSASDGVTVNQIGVKITTFSSPITYAANTLAVNPCTEGSGHSNGIVPDPGGTVGTAKFLREDCTWAAPPGASSLTTYTFAPVAVTLAASTTYYFGPSNGTSSVGNRAAYYMTAQQTGTLIAAELVLDSSNSLTASGATFVVYDLTQSTALMTSSPFTSAQTIPTTFSYNGLTGAITAGDQLQLVLTMPAGTTSHSTNVRLALYVQ